MLRISPDAALVEIVTAFDDAILDNAVAEPLLRDARTRLQTPNLRLEAELSYLPDATPDQRTMALQLLRSGAPGWQLLTAARVLPPASRANFLADLVPHAAGTMLLQDYIAARAATDLAALSTAVAEQRRRSGFPVPSDAFLDAALSAVAKANCVHLVSGYGSIHAIASDLQLTLEAMSPAATNAIAQALAQLVSAYASAASQPLLVERHSVDVALAALAARFSASARDDLAAALRRWVTLAIPQQTLSASKDRDEPDSRALFELVRHRVSRLSNEAGSKRCALSLGRLSLEIFAALPRATREMQEDVTQLEHSMPAEDLGAYLEKMARSGTIEALVLELRRSGFRTTAKGPAGVLFALFEACLGVGDPATSTAWETMRRIARELGDRAADVGVVILEGLQAHPGFASAPTAMKAAVLTDIERLRREAAGTTPRVRRAWTASDATTSRAESPGAGAAWSRKGSTAFVVVVLAAVLSGAFLLEMNKMEKYRQSSAEIVDSISKLYGGGATNDGEAYIDVLYCRGEDDRIERLRRMTEDSETVASYRLNMNLYKSRVEDFQKHCR